MANLTPTPGWDEVFQLETDTPVLGGAGGVANSQAQALLNRLEFLKLNTANQFQDYAALRAYTGLAKTARITGLLVTAQPQGIAGFFQYDETDTTSADNGGTIIVGSDGRRWKRQFNGEVFIDWFEGTDTQATQAAVNATRALGGGTVCASDRTYDFTAKIDLFQGSAINLVIKGVGRGATIFQTSADIVVFEHAENCVFEDFSMLQIGTAKTGRAFSTPTNKQAAYCVYERLSVSGFKFGIWWRYSLWCSVRDVRFNVCGAGIKASRNAFPDDQTNPASPGAWNLDPGFFHNQNTFENVLCNGGEVGIYGTFNGCVFDNVTCQGQSDSSGASNVVLPVGEQGVGLWLQGQSSAIGNTFGSQGNIIVNYYAEFTRQPMIFDRCQVKLESFYAQGGPSSGAAYPQVIKTLNGAIVNGQGCAASGSDWFSNHIVATDSTIRGELAVGAVNGNTSSLTNTRWFRNNGSGPGSNVYFSLTGTGLTQTLYTMPKRIGAVRVVCSVLRDGAAVRYGSWTVYFHQSGFSAVVADSENLLAATITVSGSDIIYTTTEAVSHLVTAHVLPMAFLGETRANGIYQVL